MRSAPKQSPFRFAPSFHAIEDTGSFVPGDFEAQYEELYAEVLDAGPMTLEDRQRLDLAASALGIDRRRLDALEQAFLAAYEARQSKTETQLPHPESLADDVEQSESRLPSLVDELEFDDPTLTIGAVPPETNPSPAHAARPPPPHDPHGELHAWFRDGTPDEQFRAAALVVQRGVATRNERDFYEAHRPTTPLRPMRPLTAEAWETLLLHPHQDRLAGNIFSVIASAVLLGRVTAMRRDKSLPKLDASKKQNPATSTVSVTRALSWSAATMGLQAPPLYLHPQDDVGFEFVTAVPPALRVGARMLSGQSAIQLAFHCARQLSWFRSEHFVCTLVPSLSNLDDLFVAALTIGSPKLDLRADVRARIQLISRAIVPVLEPSQLDTLRFHVSRFLESGGRTSLRNGARSAELTSCRAGLLLAGDLAVASEILVRESNGAERVHELETFWVSNEHTELRRQLGVAIV